MRGLMAVLSILLSLGVSAPSARAAEKGAGGDLPARALAGLKKATAYMQSISTHGGYAGIYSLDLKQRYGESEREKVKPTEIFVQPPGTPSVGIAFLRAYRATGDPQFLDAARAAALALAWGQRTHGGWDHLVDVAHMKPDAPPQRLDGNGCFDDGITQTALTFLMDLDETVDEPWLTQTIDLSMGFMLKSQYPNGGWPQWYPLVGGYHDDYTFNDGAMNECIDVMLRAYDRYGDKRYLQSALRGGDFIILSQLPPPQAGWAQQYSADVKPAKARTFEPAAACSLVASRNLSTLMKLYQVTGDEKYLKPIPPAIDWLERSKIGDNQWSRLYELGTNRPIYGDRDGKVYYDLSQVSQERQEHYGWQGGFGIPEVVAKFRKGVKPRSETASAPKKLGKPDSYAPGVEQALAAMDAQGRWASGGFFTTKAFVKNVALISAYLERVNAQPSK